MLYRVEVGKLKTTKTSSQRKTKKKELTVREKFKNVDNSVKSTFFTAILFIFIIAGVGITQMLGISYAAELFVQELPEKLTSKIEQDPRSEYIDGISLVKRFYAQDDHGTTYDVFCLDRWKRQMPDITYNKEASPVADRGLAYLLTQLYPVNPNFLPGKNIEEKQYIAQLTIWYYQDRKAGYSDDVNQCDTSKGNINEEKCVENGEVENPTATHYWKNQLLSTEKASIKASQYWSTMEPLINAAYNFTEDTNYGISINKETISYHLVENGAYIESSLFEPQHTGSNYTGYSFTSESNDVTFYNEQNVKVEKGTVLTSGQRVKFRVPVDKLQEENTLKLNVQFTGSFVRNEAYLYNPAQDTYQKILIGAIKIEPKNTEFTLVLEIPMGSVKVSKVDATTGEELEGATMVVTNKKTGEIVDQWVSGKEPHVIDPIAEGEYTLTETIVPEGYQQKTTSVDFTVEKGQVTEVEMENVPEIPVPNTASTIPPYLYIIGAIAFIIGVVLIIVAVKEPHHES